MTPHEPAGTSQPPRPAQTGGEGEQTSPPLSSPSQRRDDALLIETSSGYSHDEA